MLFMSSHWYCTSSLLIGIFLTCYEPITPFLTKHAKQPCTYNLLLFFLQPRSQVSHLTAGSGKMRDPGNEVGFPLQKNNAGIVVAMIDAESECVLSILH